MHVKAGHDVDFDGCWCSHYPGSSLRSSQSLSAGESLALKETILVSPGSAIGLVIQTPSIHWMDARGILGIKVSSFYGPLLLSSLVSSLCNLLLSCLGVLNWGQIPVLAQ